VYLLDTADAAYLALTRRGGRLGIGLLFQQMQDDPLSADLGWLWLALGVLQMDKIVGPDSFLVRLVIKRTFVYVDRQIVVTGQGTAIIDDLDVAGNLGGDDLVFAHVGNGFDGLIKGDICHIAANGVDLRSAVLALGLAKESDAQRHKANPAIVLDM